MLLDRKQALCQEADKYGWTPLHYAALFGHLQIAKQIVKTNKSVAYLTTDKDGASALHIAAGQGHTDIMAELLLHCPDCGEMVTLKGQNILHTALINEQKKVINMILDNPKLSHLIGERDMDGNTPLHLLGISGCYVPKLMNHPRANKMAFNNENMTPLDVAYTEKYSSDWVSIFAQYQFHCVYFCNFLFKVSDIINFCKRKDMVDMWLFDPLRLRPQFFRTIYP